MADEKEATTAAKATKAADKPAAEKAKPQVVDSKSSPGTALSASSSR